MANSSILNRHWAFYYDGNCGFCCAAVSLMSRADIGHKVDWIPLQSLSDPPVGLNWADLNRSAYLVDTAVDTAEMKPYEGFYAFRKLTICLWPLAPFAPIFWLPGASIFGVAIYRWIAKNRYRFSPCLTSSHTQEPESKESVQVSQKQSSK